MLTVERLREVLSYDTETGLFTWKAWLGQRAIPGKPAGSVTSKGYVYITIDGQGYMAHRLALMYVEGQMPPAQVDHINGTKSDNRRANLRHASNTTNLQNLRRARRDSRSDVMGAHRLRNGRWQARITVHGIRKSLGTYETSAQAGEAYLFAKRELHEGNTL
jgi:hypothetical protein